MIRDSAGQIVEVSLARTWATDADIEPLVAVKTLKRLDLSLTYVSDRGVERLKQLDRLEDLNLYAAEFITDAALAFLRGHRQLKSLNVRGTDVTDTSLAYIATLSEPHRARHQLYADHRRGDGAPGVALPDRRAESWRQQDQRRRAARAQTAARGSASSASTASNAATPVGAGRRSVTDFELETIALLGGLEDLNIGLGVGLGTPRPTDLGPADGEAECRIAGGTRITDFGLSKVAQLKKLRRLDLGGTSITVSGLKTLASLPELRRLTLWNVAAIDDTAAPYLESLHALDTLDLLEHGCRRCDARRGSPGSPICVACMCLKRR